MDAMYDLDAVQVVKDRLADRYTSQELCELLEVPVEDIIETYWDLILEKAEVFKEGELGDQ